MNNRMILFLSGFLFSFSCAFAMEVSDQLIKTIGPAAVTISIQERCAKINELEHAKRLSATQRSLLEGHVIALQVSLQKEHLYLFHPNNVTYVLLPEADLIVFEDLDVQVSKENRVICGKHAAEKNEEIIAALMAKHAELPVCLVVAPEVGEASVGGDAAADLVDPVRTDVIAPDEFVSTALAAGDPVAEPRDGCVSTVKRPGFLAMAGDFFDIMHRGAPVDELFVGESQGQKSIPNVQQKNKRSTFWMLLPWNWCKKR